MIRRAISPRVATSTGSSTQGGLVGFAPGGSGPPPRPAEGLFRPDLGHLELDPDFLDAGQYFGPQLVRHSFVPAAVVDQLLDELFQVVLSQARAALVEVLGDLGAVPWIKLLVQVGVELRK